MNVELSVTFNEAMKGVAKTVTFTKDVKCKTCSGSKETSGSKSS